MLAVSLLRSLSIIVNVLFTREAEVQSNCDENVATPTFNHKNKEL